MKRFLIILTLLSSALSAKAQSEDIIKTGYNFGPLPAIAFDADKGFQYGAILNIYNYGDGTNYPNYNSKLYLEASFFTKGSSLYTISFDNKELIPGVRWSSAATLAIDKAMDFYGFNGYGAYYDHARIALGDQNKHAQNPDNFLFSPYYKVDRVQFLGKTDFIGDITENLKWEAGYHFSYFQEGGIDRASINKGKEDYNVFPETQSTLYEDYMNWGLIGSDEAAGGFVSSIRLGLVYDSRDKEGAPSRGTWAEGHIIAAPKWLGSKNPFYRYSLTLRQYFPIIDNDKLTFAYRLNYQGTFGSSAPYYILPYQTIMGEGYDKDGMGGYRTVRGIMRDRVIGLDMASYNAEIRWRFIKFQLFNQNIALALNLFSDGTMVTKGRDMTFKGKEEYRQSYEAYMAKGQDKDRPHITTGAGFRFIMNENFIVCLEYGLPVTQFYQKSHPLYGQDGKGAFYINIGYLF